MGTFAPVDAFLRRIINGAKSIPTTGILGLIVLWFSLEERAKILFLFLGAIFYMVIMVKNAILSVSEDYIRVALDIGANRWQMVSRRNERFCSQRSAFEKVAETRDRSS